MGAGCEIREISPNDPDLEITTKLTRVLSQSSDGVGGCSWALLFPKWASYPEKQLFRSLEQVKNFLEAKKNRQICNTLGGFGGGR